MFDERGNLSYTVPIPFLFRPDAAFDSIIAGSFAGGTAIASSALGTMYTTIALPSGTVKSTVYIPHPKERGRTTDTEKGLSHGARSPSGDLTFMTSGGREIVRYSEAGSILGIAPPPTYTKQLPNSRDVEEFQSRMLFGRRPSTDEVRAFAEEPKRYAIPGRSAIYDEAGRLWVLTLRDRDEASWIDVYDSDELVHTVMVRDRVYGFDIQDSILATLVERRQLDRDGMPVRAIDWYKVPVDNWPE